MDSTGRLLEAIKAFEEEHGENTEFRDVFDSLVKVEKSLAKPEEETPGRKAAREAQETAAERAKAREPKEAPEPRDAGEQPKSFKEARERAKERFAEPKEESAEPEPTAA